LPAGCRRSQVAVANVAVHPGLLSRARIVEKLTVMFSEEVVEEEGIRNDLLVKNAPKRRFFRARRMSETRRFRAQLTLHEWFA